MASIILGLQTFVKGISVSTEAVVLEGIVITVLNRGTSYTHNYC